MQECTGWRNVCRPYVHRPGHALPTGYREAGRGRHLRLDGKTYALAVTERLGLEAPGVTVYGRATFADDLIDRILDSMRRGGYFDAGLLIFIIKLVWRSQ
jgi:hypothetical protein